MAKLETKVLEGLNPEQSKAVTHGEGPLLIVAGAGTGKTTVITRRIAYLIEQGVKPEEILALAFGDKAAAEMEERVDRLLPYGYNNLQISTFHAFGELVLREHGLALGLPDFKVLDEVGQWLLIRNNLDKFDLDYYRPLGNSTRFVKALVNHFERAKDELIAPAEYLDYAEKLKLAQDQAEAGASVADEEARRLVEVANAYHVYQRLLLLNNALDFGDLINYTLELFRRRPRVLAHYRERFKYLLIDEFQDTNFAQYELLKLLAAPKNNITVVGDDDQSIFKFRGASISNILHFQKDYPKSVFVSLTKNYRTGQKILDAAHKFIQQNDPDRLEVRLNLSKKLLNPDNPGGEIVPLVAPDYFAEARGVVETILELRAKDSEITWDDFAIMARAHDTLEPFINILDENDIPYIYFANKGLYRKRVILDVLAYFRLLDSYHESQALYRVLNLPIFKIQHAAIVELSHHARKRAVSLYEAVKDAGALEVVDKQSLLGIQGLLKLLQKHTATARAKSMEQVFIEAVNDLDLGEAAMRDYQVAKYLEGFRRRIQNFQTENVDKSLKNFMSQLNFELEAGGEGELEFDPEAGPEAVKLMTVHGAKGLEFRHVFVVGLVDKRFPSIARRDPIELPSDLIKDILPVGDIHLEEERRLFYVAMTRAKETLYLTRALNYGGKLAKKPSRFLLELVGLAEPTVRKASGKIVFRERPAVTTQKLPVPKSFSFSQISSFLKCPLEYKYTYVLKLPLPQQPSASFGQTLHLTFKKFLLQYQLSGQPQDLFGAIPAPKLPAFDTLKKLYGENWIDDWYPNQTEKARYRTEGEQMLKSFYDECQARPPHPKYLEKVFRLKFEKTWFTGAIDRADETPDGLLIIDYKTGKKGALSPVNKQQLLIYQWAAQEQMGEKVADLQYWYFRDRLEKQSFLGTPEDVLSLKEHLLTVIGEILAAIKSDDFYERDLRTNHKVECQYRKFEL